MSQIIAGIKMNTNSGMNTTHSLRMAAPLKIYRRELASGYGTRANRRSSGISIDAASRPGGLMPTAAASAVAADLSLTLDAKFLKIDPHACAAFATGGTCMAAEADARRRVRSAGMTSRAQNAQRNGDGYHADSRQYLTSRSKSFAQNQYNFVKVGDPLKKPGSATTENNLYAPAGISTCKKYFLANASAFQYQWTTAGMSAAEPSPTTVALPAGEYDLADVAQIMRNTMAANKHYYVSAATGTNVYLLDIVPGAGANATAIQFQSLLTNGTLFPPARYFKTLALTAAATTPLASATYCPYFIIPAALSDFFGIAAGSYPAFGRAGGVVTASSTLQSDVYTNSGGAASCITTPSTRTPLVGAYPFVKLYYKPNNSQFAQQGAVSASSRLTRLKYNTVSANTTRYRAAYGNAVASAMAYSVDGGAYTLKDKLGLGASSTPVFSKNATVVSGSTYVRVRR